MKRLCLLGVLLGLSCAPTPESDRRAVWTTASFVAAIESGDGGASFGGWTPDWLLSLPGAPLRFRSGAFAPGGNGATMAQGAVGLTVFPGYSAGQPVAYTITDIWYQTPQPWVQPTYTGLADSLPDGTPVGTVFPVGVAGSFYSSFWRQETVDPLPVGGAPIQATSATELLTLVAHGEAQLTDGDIILCPLVPDNATIARSDLSLNPVHPFTGVQVVPSLAAGEKNDYGLTPFHAYVDGHPTRYLGFGSWRAQASGDTLFAGKLFVFGTIVDGAFVDVPQVPAVLPDDALHDSLMQRIEVTLPAAAGAFLPAGSASLAPRLSGARVPLALGDWADAGATVLDGGTVVSADGGVLGVVTGAPNQYLKVDPSIDETLGRRYMLRVAMNPACFQPDGGFPDACRWLDSQANLEAWLPDSQLNPDVVTLSVGLLQEVTP